MLNQFINTLILYSLVHTTSVVFLGLCVLPFFFILLTKLTSLFSLLIFFFFFVFLHIDFLLLDFKHVHFVNVCHILIFLHNFSKIHVGHV